VGSCIEVVELSSRHYKRYAQEIIPVKDANTIPGGALYFYDPAEERIGWTRTDEPPISIWTTSGHAEGLAYFVTDPEASTAVWPLISRESSFARIRDAARRHHAALAPSHVS
jgi:hypothetical protein